MAELPVFITGNQNKADYLSRMLGIELQHQKVNLDEIQSTNLDEIVAHKVKQAYELVKKPVLVEDVALSFEALGGLPGPFVKFFVDAKDGLEKMCRMCDSLENRNARAECVFGFYDGERLELLRGGLSGTIADHPQGDGGYGWDQLFCPEGYGGRTRAELTQEENEETYQIIKPFDQLRELLQYL
jgi:non-canonical purine NTP pyrophosphatase (RdgB/HAM1 family)